MSEYHTFCWCWGQRVRPVRFCALVFIKLLPSWALLYYLSTVSYLCLLSLWTHAAVQPISMRTEDWTNMGLFNAAIQFCVNASKQTKCNGCDAPQSNVQNSQSCGMFPATHIHARTDTARTLVGAPFTTQRTQLCILSLCYVCGSLAIILSPKTLQRLAQFFLKSFLSPKPFSTNMPSKIE